MLITVLSSNPLKICHLESHKDIADLNTAQGHLCEVVHHIISNFQSDQKISFGRANIHKNSQISSKLQVVMGSRCSSF